MQIETLKAQAQELKTKIEEAKKYDRLVNEGGDGYKSHEQYLNEYSTVLFELSKLEFAAEWTPETTTVRRQAWNKSGATPSNMRAIQEKLGFTFADLKKAIALNNL